MMSFTRSFRSLSALVLMSLAASGSFALDRGSTAESAKLEALERQIVELKQRATVCEVNSARSQQQIARLRDELAAARSELQRLADRATAAVSTAPPASSLISGEDQSIDIEELEDPDPPTRPRPSATTVESGAQDPPTPAPGPPSPEAIALYDEGYTLFHQEQYTEAEKRFEEFIRRHPATDFTDNAQFWIGESRYARGQFSSALIAFIATVDNYPNGNKVSDALFKAGKCLEALGQTEQARETYLEVQERFPQSAAAAGARDRLAAGL